MQSFVYQPASQRVVFGAGGFDELAGEAERLGLGKLLVVSSPGRKELASRAAVLLGARCAAISDAATTNVPEFAFDAAKTAAGEINADGMVVLGGGSAIGLGKALAADTGLPFIAVPSTYSGSEMAPNWNVETANGIRRGGGEGVLPVTVIYDPELTLDLPPKISAASGMNAMAHAVESLYGANANPVTVRMAEEGVRILADNLPIVVEQPNDIEARTDALYGAWLAAAFRGGTAIEHRIAQTIRHAYELSHADTHAVVLPYAVAFNRDAAQDAMERIQRALAAGEAASGLYDLNVALGLPTGLKDLGLAESVLDAAADAIADEKLYNPRPASRDDIRSLLGEMYQGDRPEY